MPASRPSTCAGVSNSPRRSSTTPGSAPRSAAATCGSSAYVAEPVNPTARRPNSPRAARSVSSAALSTAARISRAAHEQDLARRRELDAARRAVQQRHAELGLEPPDLLRERRLGHVQALGGAAEVAFLGDGDERAQVAELHAPAIYISALLNRSAISVVRA